MHAYIRVCMYSTYLQTLKWQMCMLLLIMHFWTLFQEFPSEGVAKVVRNVFDFDTYHNELLEVVVRVLHKHGIPAGASASKVHLAPE